MGGENIQLVGGKVNRWESGANGGGGVLLFVLHCY